MLFIELTPFDGTAPILVNMARVVLIKRVEPDGAALHAMLIYSDSRPCWLEVKETPMEIWRQVPHGILPNDHSEN